MVNHKKSSKVPNCAVGSSLHVIMFTSDYLIITVEHLIYFHA